jgi:hypothetical protein
MMLHINHGALRWRCAVHRNREKEEEEEESLWGFAGRTTIPADGLCGALMDAANLGSDGMRGMAEPVRKGN